MYKWSSLIYTTHSSHEVYQKDENEKIPAIWSLVEETNRQIKSCFVPQYHVGNNIYLILFTFPTALNELKNPHTLPCTQNRYANKVLQLKIC